MPVSTFGTSRPKRLLVLAAGRDHRVDRLDEFRIVELAGDAERHRQVEMPDPQAIDAVDRRDGIGVLHALRGLDLAEQGGLLVGGGQLLRHRAAGVGIVRDAERHAALALRVILHAVEDRARFLGVADHRQHDAFGAHVAGARDVVIFLRRHAHDRRDAGRLEIADGAFHRLKAEAGMLEIEQHELAAGVLHDVADAGRGELHDEVPQLHRLGTRHRLQARCSHHILPVVSYRRPAIFRPPILRKPDPVP